MARTTAQKRNKELTKSKDIAGLSAMNETTTMAAAALVSVDKPLTEKQKLFVKFWAEGDTIPNACERAGYNEQPSYGYRMAKMPNILAAYSSIKAKYEEAAQMSRKKVMEMLQESFDMAKLMAEPASMVSAAREIGKMCGYYEPVKVRHEHSVAGNLVFERMNRMSDDELLRVITEGSGVPGLAGPDGEDDDPSS